MNKRTIALLTIAAMLTVGMQGHPAAVIGQAPDIAFAAESTLSDGAAFFLVVGTCSGGTQLRYMTPDADGYDADKVVWANAPSDAAYGDIFISNGEPKMTLEYPHSDDPAYAQASQYVLDADTVLTNIGNVNDSMDAKELTVEEQRYDGSGHWSIDLVDAEGNVYDYGLNVVDSALGINPAFDLAVGDTWHFAFFEGNIMIPLQSAAQEAAPTGDITIDEKNFPDEAFRAYVAEHCDTKKDGVLTEEEIAAVTEITLCRMPTQTSDEAPLIYSLKGVENFTALQSLDCGNQKIVHLDVSTLTSLERLQCYGTELPILDVSGLSKLSYLDVNDCGELTRLILDGCTSLEKLYCNSGRLTDLDTNDCTELTDLCCAYNELTTLDVRHLTKLQYLSCDHNYLAGLDLSKNKKIETLNAHENRYPIHTDAKSIPLSALPEGFQLGKVLEWTNAEASGEMLNIKDMRQPVCYSYDLGNGMSERFTILVADPYPAANLPEGATRVTLYDKNTGKLVPSDPLAQNRWRFGANIGIKNPNMPGGWMYTGPVYTVDSNPCIVDTTQLAEFYITADLFEVRGLQKREKPVFIHWNNGALDIVFYVDYKYSVLTWIDADTNEEITFSEPAELEAIPYSDAFEGRYYSIPANPAYLPYDFYDSHYRFKLRTDSPSGSYTLNSISLAEESGNVNHYNCYVTWRAKGDADGDGKFSVVDAIALQKWLLGKGGSFADWNAVDFCRDGKLDGFDMVILKRRLLEKPYTEPDTEIKDGHPLSVLAEKVKLYSAPDTDAQVLGTIPKGTKLVEMGYEDGNQDWVFTEYKGQHGWLKLMDENGDPAVIYEVYVG